MTLPAKELERIKKILALSNSPNEAEALAAANKAAEILAQYNLAMSDIDASASDRGLETQNIGKYLTAQESKWRKILLSNIAIVSGCRALIGTLSLGKKFRYDLKLIGSEVNRQVAIDLYEYLEAAIIRLADESIKTQKSIEGKLPRTYRNDFCIGAAMRISERLMEQQSRRESEGITFDDETIALPKAIVRLNHDTQAEIDVYIKDANYGPAKRINVRDSIASDLGRIAAESIGLSAQIESA